LIGAYPFGEVSHFAGMRASKPAKIADFGDEPLHQDFYFAATRAQ